MTLHFHPSFEITARTGVDKITRVGTVYTAHLLDGTTRTADFVPVDGGRNVELLIASITGFSCTVPLPDLPAKRPVQVESQPEFFLV